MRNRRAMLASLRGEIRRRVGYTVGVRYTADETTHGLVVDRPWAR